MRVRVPVGESAFEQAGFACVECGFCKRRDDGSSILQIDHIDGDSSNDDIDNLRVLCPNCHALTPMYGPRNKKKGRAKLRRQRLKEHKQSEGDFVTLVLSLHEKGTIDFSKFDWVQKLAELLSEMPQVTGRRARKLLPDFTTLNASDVDGAILSTRNFMLT